MSYFSKALITFILAVGIFIIATLLLNTKRVKDIKDKDSCDKADSTTGKCQLWDGNNCWKGECEGDYSQGSCSCVRKNIVPQLLIMLSGSLILLFLYFLIRGFKHKTAKFAMSFSSSRLSDYE